MSILKYKYKAHKFINYAFYVVVFIAGYLLGFGAEKIDFNKLISQVLMIDNVQAYTFYSDSNYTVDEDFIYNTFVSKFSNFDIETHKNIFCSTHKSNGKTVISCYAMDDTSASTFYYAGASGYWWTWRFGNGSESSPTKMYSFQFNTSSYSISAPVDGNYYSIASFMGQNSTKATYKSASNFDITGASINVLDFSDYIIKLEYNENLFKDNPDFKEVCVEEGKSFAITSTQMSDINSVYDYDYFWLPYNLNGISKILYDNSVETNEIHYTEEEAKERYFYNTKENIDSFYSNDIPGLELEIKGYTDKYSYYGWSAWPFRVYYSESYNQYNIFTIEEPTKIYVGNLNEDGNVHGGGGLRLDGDEEIEISSNYCFYIKNIYEVTYVNIDEWGDYYGTVPTPNGDHEFSTSHNKLNSNTDSFLNQPIKFINSMKDTINLINSLIYEFYISLPTLIRTFIITVLIILLIMLIMSIGGYK